LQFHPVAEYEGNELGQRSEWPTWKRALPKDTTVGRSSFTLYLFPRVNTRGYKDVAPMEL